MQETAASMEYANTIYQNANMGMQSISYLQNRVRDNALKKSLQKQFNQYNKIASKAIDLLTQSGDFPDQKSTLQELSAWAGVQLNLLKDPSPGHIAQMVIQGTTMGVTELLRLRKEYPDVPEILKDLSKCLLEEQEQNIEEMKAYLQ